MDTISFQYVGSKRYDVYSPHYSYYFCQIRSNVVQERGRDFLSTKFFACFCLEILRPPSADPE